MHNLLNQLTLTEKLELLIGEDMWHTKAIERLGLDSIRMCDGPHGLRKMVNDRESIGEVIPSIAFPTLSALSTTWNPDLAYQMGTALASECQLNEVDVLLGPGINIKRTPLCGRNFEYFSEDPFLAGKMATAYTLGVEEHGTATCLKHFSANNQEFDRMCIDSKVDLRTLHEIYFKPFEMVISDASPSSIMCAYNKLNGTYCSQNKWLLTDILRDTLGFKGLAVSDWWAVHDSSASLKAGLELQMPYADYHLPNLMAAYEKGEITIEEIDAAVETILSFIDDRIKARQMPPSNISMEEKHQLAKDIALESMVLLKNEDHLLPITTNKFKKVVLIGEYADKPFIQGGGSARVNALFVDSTVETLKEIAPKDLEIHYAGVYATWTPHHDVENILRGIEAAKEADIAVVFVGTGDIVETESADREHIKLKKAAEILILQVAKVNPNTVVVLQAGSAIDMSSWISEVKAVVLQGFSGCASGSALAEILLGHVSPSGKLTETYPLHLEDCPAYEEDLGNGLTVHYIEGIMVGYRYYNTYNKEVAFPFGFGLSYTDFSYNHLAIQPNEDGEKMNISCEITNIGTYAAKEIAQLYVHYENSPVIRPVQELKGFQKVFLNPGETKIITFSISKEDLTYFDATSQTWKMDEPSVTFQVGSSSRAIHLSDTLMLNH
ncbi:MAG: glycosyl hydrolase [Cellulosilyticum sp.]|nr:glycosyl hydrolase [Cellulosilyticum sp.]